MTPMSRADWEVISVYTRRQALADGLLLDATPQAREAGFCRPLAVTATLKADIPSSDDLVSILFQFHSLIIAGHGSDSLLVLPDVFGAPAWLHVGSDDEAQPCLTLMRPEDY